ncbi:phage protease [Paracoccus sanguinis]|uniref:phage protease n=1 Tax=Paracoccus sanguinis TaxID=1545044 RepID=UPI00051FBBF2|nr:phage protease [Paracoccus sanguinis]KGJ21046.1 hypothetical protein IX55_03765 [Paracoccus sanguinis]
MTDTLERHTAALTAEVSADAPSRIELIPTGAFRTADRRGEFSIDDAAEVISASLAAAPGGQMCVDFGHGIHGGGERRSSAAGWITSLEQEGDRIMAAVEWTPEGARALRDRAYRFVSPVFKTRGRKVVLIEGAGLVNNPALPQLRQLASQQEDIQMDDIKKIAAAVGLGEDAGVDAILASIAASKEQGERNATVLASVMDAAGVSDLSDEGVRQLCARAGDEPDPTRYVPKVALDEVTRQLAALQGEVSAKSVEAAIDAAKKAGKLTPAMEGWGRQLASRDLEAFEAFAASAPVIVGGERQLEGAAPAGDADELTPTERQICAVTGVDPARFLATRKGEA